MNPHLTRLLESQLVFERASVLLNKTPYKQYILLVILSQFERSLTHSELAEFSKFPAPTVTNQCSKLESKEYITIVTFSADRRYKLINMTKRGKSRLLRLHKMVEASDKKTLKNFPFPVESS